ncbi:hypothetical protein B5S31_g4765 [[Candida] boidinii]|nr:hypothetical protein B5S31_g4765 [[Candida] boidinii]OWB80935.1 hypothetical protein B5S32_g5265 [[Candida] boidinii]
MTTYDNLPPRVKSQRIADRTIKQENELKFKKNNKLSNSSSSSSSSSILMNRIEKPTIKDIYPGLNDITDALESLPYDLIRYFTLLKEIDAKCVNTVPFLKSYIIRFLQMSQKHPKREILLSKIRDLIRELMPCLEEKMHVATIASDTVNTHLKRIDQSYKIVLEHEISEDIRIGPLYHPSMKLQEQKSAQTQRSESRREALAAKKANQSSPSAAASVDKNGNSNGDLTGDESTNSHSTSTHATTTNNSSRNSSNKGKKSSSSSSSSSSRDSKDSKESKDSKDSKDSKEKDITSSSSKSKDSNSKKRKYGQQSQSEDGNNSNTNKSTISNKSNNSNNSNTSSKKRSQVKSTSSRGSNSKEKSKKEDDKSNDKSNDNGSDNNNNNSKKSNNSNFNNNSNNNNDDSRSNNNGNGNNNVSSSSSSSTATTSSLSSSSNSSSSARSRSSGNKSKSSSSNSSNSNKNKKQEEIQDILSPSNGEFDGEPVYCYCQQVSYGEMVGCDGANCKREWFHLPCIGLKELPRGEWYCDDCRAKMQKRR